MNKAPVPGRKAPDIALVHPGRANGRRFALVSKVLSAMGLRHHAVLPYISLRKPGRIEQAALADPHCNVARRTPANIDLVIGTRGDVNKRSAAKAARKLYLSFDTEGHFSGKGEGDSFFLPILFHPDLINDEAYEEAERLSQQKERPIGVLFAGNCDPATYGKSAMQRCHGILDRIQIGKLASATSGQTAFFPSSREEFSTALEAGSLADRLVWIDTNRFRIPQQEWLSFIAQSRFFISTPGVQYPYCQNLNEAAACGSVPILQFPGLYDPPLRDCENCLEFKDGNGFADTINTALSMKTGKWLALSGSARDYHQAHLSLDHLENRIASFIKDDSRRELTWVMAGKKH